MGAFGQCLLACSFAAIFLTFALPLLQLFCSKWCEGATVVLLRICAKCWRPFCLMASGLNGFSPNQNTKYILIIHMNWLGFHTTHCLILESPTSSFLYENIHRYRLAVMVPSDKWYTDMPVVLNFLGLILTSNVSLWKTPLPAHTYTMSFKVRALQ